MATGDPADALTETDEGTLIAFDVTPDASDQQVPSDFNEWRECFEARLTEPARDGRANAELTEAVADRLDAPARLAQGATSSRKMVAVAAPYERVREKLTNALDE